MATIDTHRASYQKPNNNLMLKKQAPLTPTITETVDFIYFVSYGGKRRICRSIGEVNAILASNPSAKVVKTTKTTTVKTTHKRIR